MVVNSFLITFVIYIWLLF